MLNLTIACWDYDRVRPMMDGRVRIEGAVANFLSLAPEETFFRAFRDGEFEVSELSLSSTLMQLSRGECRYTPIPVFPSRSFRHSSIYIRVGSGIERPQDMSGRRIAVSEYQVTAAMTARGLLQDEYGVRPSDIHWIQAGLEQAGRQDKVGWVPPADVRIDKVADRTIAELIDDGTVDGFISPRAPSWFAPAQGKVRRLFPEDGSHEADWYHKRGVFPIMHVIGIRSDVLAANPWVANSLVNAFIAAKDIALSELAEVNALKISLPLLTAHVAAARQLFGADFWSYGLDKNRSTLETQLRWSFEQGLSTRPLGVDELFAPSTLARYRV